MINNNCTKYYNFYNYILIISFLIFLYIVIAINIKNNFCSVKILYWKYMHLIVQGLLTVHPFFICPEVYSIRLLPTGGVAKDLTT